MSRGHGGRSSDGRGNREGGKTEKEGRRSSRTAVRMTAERARAIQSHADQTGSNQDWKARAASAGDRNELNEAEEE